MTISRGQMNRQLYEGGGIMSLSKEGIGGGSIKGVDMGSRIGFFNPFKEAKKVVKKVTGGIKDILSSDIGKTALAGAALYFGGPKIMKGIQGLGPLPDFLTGKAAKSLAIGAAGSLLGGVMAKAQEGDEEAIAATRNVDALKTYLRQGYRNLKEDGTEDADALEAQVNRDVSEYSSGAGGYAQGGRIGYALGDSASDNAIQAAGIEGLPIRQNPKGVKELDLRETGGFIPPVGIKEKEDDIPAMLSNNEFVFTADAVRGMGDGDVDVGAQRMYDMMKTLEKGGRV
jgi:hypothetical protein